jgi:hypothetical protein
MLRNGGISSASQSPLHRPLSLLDAQILMASTACGLGAWIWYETTVRQPAALWEHILRPNQQWVRVERVHESFYFCLLMWSVAFAIERLRQSRA